jgi:DNA gyrase/topoisomerase IV subunit B
MYVGELNADDAISNMLLSVIEFSIQNNQKLSELEINIEIDPYSICVHDNGLTFPYPLIKTETVSVAELMLTTLYPSPENNDVVVSPYKYCLPAVVALSEEVHFIIGNCIFNQLYENGEVVVPMSKWRKDVKPKHLFGAAINFTIGDNYFKGVQCIDMDLSLLTTKIQELLIGNPHMSVLISVNKTHFKITESRVCQL